MSMNILILIAFFAVMYFLMIRPQQKAAKQRQEMINTVAPGAQVITIGGLHGVVNSVNNAAKTFELDAEGVILVFELSAIRTVVKAAAAVESEAVVAEDAEVSSVAADVEEVAEDVKSDADSEAK